MKCCYSELWVWCWVGKRRWRSRSRWSGEAPVEKLRAAPSIDDPQTPSSPSGSWGCRLTLCEQLQRRRALENTERGHSHRELRVFVTICDHTRLIYNKELNYFNSRRFIQAEAITCTHCTIDSLGSRVFCLHNRLQIINKKPHCGRNTFILW